MCEAEVMRRSVLPYQFTAGLVPEIKHKIAGCTSTFKELFSEHELRRLNDADRCNALDLRMMPLARGLWWFGMKSGIGVHACVSPCVQTKLRSVQNSGDTHAMPVVLYKLVNKVS